MTSCTRAVWPKALLRVEISHCQAMNDEASKKKKKNLIICGTRKKQINHKFMIQPTASSPVQK